MRVTIFGAGTIGCYLGAEWAAAGVTVRLIERGAVVTDVAQAGLQVTGGVHHPPGRLTIETGPDALGAADLVVLTIKGTGLPPAVPVLAEHVPPGVPILCLLNGVAAARTLAAHLPDHPILSGLVPFNVVWSGPGRLDRFGNGAVTTARTLILTKLAQLVASRGAPLTVTDQIEAVQYGKLLLNLNNPINALSGLDLITSLRDRGYRQIYAATLAEALGVYARADLRHAKVAVLPAPMMVPVLRAPNWLFNRVALPLQGLRAGAQTSMAVDLAAGRPTEIADLNGEIVRLAEAAGQTAPLNAGLMRLIRAAEGGNPTRYDPAAMARALGLSVS